MFSIFGFHVLDFAFVVLVSSSVVYCADSGSDLKPKKTVHWEAEENLQKTFTYECEESARPMSSTAKAKQKSIAKRQEMKKKGLVKPRPTARVVLSSAASVSASAGSLSVSSVSSDDVQPHTQTHASDPFAAALSSLTTGHPQTQTQTNAQTAAHAQTANLDEIFGEDESEPQFSPTSQTQLQTQLQTQTQSLSTAGILAKSGFGARLTSLITSAQSSANAAASALPSPLASPLPLPLPSPSASASPSAAAGPTQPQAGTPTVNLCRNLHEALYAWLYFVVCVLSSSSGKSLFMFVSYPFRCVVTVAVVMCVMLLWSFVALCFLRFS